jgi:hypothetical protein
MKLSNGMKYALLIFLLVIIIGSLLFNYWQSFNENFENSSTEHPEFYVATPPNNINTKVNEINGLAYITEKESENLNFDNQYVMFDIRKVINDKTEFVYIGEDRSTGDKNMNVIPILKEDSVDVFYLARFKDNESNELEYLSTRRGDRDTILSGLGFVEKNAIVTPGQTHFGTWKIEIMNDIMNINLASNRNDMLLYRLRANENNGLELFINNTEPSVDSNIKLRIRDGGFQFLVRMGDTDVVKSVNMSRLRNQTLPSDNKEEDIKNIILNSSNASEDVKDQVYNLDKPNLLFTAKSFPIGALYNEFGYIYVNMYPLIVDKNVGIEPELKEILNSDTTRLFEERKNLGLYIDSKPSEYLRKIANGARKDDLKEDEDDNNDTDDGNNDGDDNNNGDEEDDIGEFKDDLRSYYKRMKVKSFDSVLLTGEPASVFADNILRKCEKCSTCGNDRDGVSCDCRKYKCMNNNKDNNENLCNRVLTNPVWL